MRPRCFPTGTVARTRLIAGLACFGLLILELMFHEQIENSRLGAQFHAVRDWPDGGYRNSALSGEAGRCLRGGRTDNRFCSIGFCRTDDWPNNRPFLPSQADRQDSLGISSLLGSTGGYVRREGSKTVLLHIDNAKVAGYHSPTSG